MSDIPNLNDPSVEPTDAELAALAVRAFSGVRAAHEESTRALRAKIAEERTRVMRDLADDSSDPGGRPRIPA